MLTMISPNVTTIGELIDYLKEFSTDTKLAYCDFGMAPMLIYDKQAQRMIVAGNSYFNSHNTDIQTFVDFANKKDSKGKLIPTNDAFWLTIHGYSVDEVDTTIHNYTTEDKNTIILPSGNRAKIIRKE